MSSSNPMLLGILFCAFSLVSWGLNLLCVRSDCLYLLDYHQYEWAAKWKRCHNIDCLYKEQPPQKTLSLLLVKSRLLWHCNQDKSVVQNTLMKVCGVDSKGKNVHCCRTDILLNACFPSVVLPSSKTWNFPLAGKNLKFVATVIWVCFAGNWHKQWFNSQLLFKVNLMPCARLSLFVSVYTCVVRAKARVWCTACG